MKTLLLADNQAVTKAGLLFFANKMTGFDRIREVTDKKELLSFLSAFPQAVVVLDYTLFDLASIEELIILQERFKQVIWILFSDELSEGFIRRLLFSSASFGILLKDASLPEIETALQNALKGEHFICERISNLLRSRKEEKEITASSLLTSTEREILKAIALGKTTKEIAAERFSSIHTITTHRKNIFRKLEINNVFEATKYAFRAGIIDMAEYSI